MRTEPMLVILIGSESLLLHVGNEEITLEEGVDLAIL